METRKKIMRLLGILFFWAGVLLGMTLAGGAVWADIEAAFYGFQKMGDEPLNLRCPAFVTAAEPGQIASTFKNPTEKTMQLMVRTDVSGYGGIRSARTTFTIAPGEAEKARWPVTSEDVDLGFFIFARVSSFPAYPLPFRESTCGMLFIRTTALTGNQIFVLSVVVSLLSMAAGLALWQISHRPLQGQALNATWAMRALAAIVIVGMFVGFQGWWAVGIIMMVLMALMIVTMMYLAAPD
ncbi:MAG: hypothetical protein JXM73_19235 [Anaerolineae bacterium]|nr:hypothetical protein [Anaerolineae bacterium]